MSTRQEKVQELLKEEISDILRRELKDPRLGFVTITDAQVSPDMRHAKIFISVLGAENVRKENMAVLKKSEKYVRQMLAKRMRMRTVPEIDFRFDESVDRGIKMLELLEKIKHEEENESS